MVLELEAEESSLSYSLARKTNIISVQWFLQLLQGNLVEKRPDSFKLQSFSIRTIRGRKALTYSFRIVLIKTAPFWRVSINTNIYSQF